MGSMPPEIAEMAAITKALVALERLGDWLNGACVGLALGLLTIGTIWFLLALPLLVGVTLMVGGARWYARRRIRQLDAAMESA